MLHLVALKAHLDASLGRAVRALITVVHSLKSRGLATRVGRLRGKLFILSPLDLLEVDGGVTLGERVVLVSTGEGLGVLHLQSTRIAVRQLPLLLLLT